MTARNQIKPRRTIQDVPVYYVLWGGTEISIIRRCDIPEAMQEAWERWAQGITCPGGIEGFEDAVYSWDWMTFCEGRPHLD